MKYCFFKLFFLLLVINISNSQTKLQLIPYPVSVIQNAGSFTINEATIICVNEESSYSNAEIFNDFLFNNYGFKLKIKKHYSGKKNTIKLFNANADKVDAESYFLVVKSDFISISGDAAGVFYGLQTLIQLLPTERNKNLNISCLEISDAPRYKWRGMHLDVSRHVFPKKFIKKYIDYLAMYKMNVFHWHLTDDQGWRIEIKKYPKLTDIGAWRKATLKGHWSVFPHEFDSTMYGGFYSQEDVKEIVEHATKRYITIVPEIEMPGHSVAALASYPELSCTGNQIEVATEWGIFDDIYCPTDKTIKFLEDVLTEVVALFPGKYIHIGGDEAPKEQWKESKFCQNLIKKEGLKDENELQSYLNRKIEKFLNSKGKTLIGWDEILVGGLTPNATVMSWRGMDGGIDAARQNHDVVMSPTRYCYFDYYQGNPKFEPTAIGGYTPIEKVYSFEPTPDSLTPKEQKHILGGQGNVWTEYIPDTKQVEYMVFPRICALAEVFWAPKDKRDYDDFKDRLINHFSLLDMLGINYSKSIYEIKLSAGPYEYNDGDKNSGIALTLSSDFKNGEIYFTLDGTEPTTKSTKNYAPIIITQNTLVKAAYFENGIRKSNFIEQQFYINKATGKNITLSNQPDKRYDYGGAMTLVDGIKGILPWYGKEWLGFKGTDCDAMIDLGELTQFSNVTIDVLNDDGSWIWLPKKVELYVSDDGNNFSKIKEVSADEIINMNREVTMDVGTITARYVRVVAENYGTIPAGHPGEGKSAWLFVDEISVN